MKKQSKNPQSPLYDRRSNSGGSGTYRLKIETPKKAPKRPK